MITAEILKKYFGFNDPNVIKGILSNLAEEARYEKEYQKRLATSFEYRTREFINSWYGKFNNYDGNYGCQCKDLFSQFNHDIVKAPYIVGNPIDMWNRPSATLLNYYKKIPNSLIFIPKLGDVAIIQAGTTGHIAIVVEGGLLKYKSLDQNFPGDIGLKPIPTHLRAGAKSQATGFPCQYVTHNCSIWAKSYKLVGVFRSKV